MTPKDRRVQESAIEHKFHKAIEQQLYLIDLKGLKQVLMMVTRLSCQGTTEGSEEVW